MYCNDGKCKKVRNGEGRHDTHKNSRNEIRMFKFSRELLIVIITAGGVAAESFYVYQFLDFNFPNLKEMGNLEAIFVEIGIAIFLTVTVYQYSGKAERDRKKRVRRQIINAFEMLSVDFSWLATQKASPTINEEFITKKNLRIFHIQNLIGTLPEKLDTTMSLQIPEFCENALQIPTIKKPLDPNKSIIIDYTGCENIVLESKKICGHLEREWRKKK